MSKCPLVIFHGNCDDGFGAAFFIHLLIGKDVDLEFFAGVYQKPPPDVTGRDVIMVDFSYKRPVLEQMITSARSMLILDHHKTAMEDLSGLVGRNGLEAKHYAQLAEWAGVNGYDPRKGALAVTFDMQRSGAGLAWDFFSDQMPRIPFVNYLEDRDLWTKNLPEGDQFTIALRSYPQDFDTWGVLLDRGVSALITEGRPLWRYYTLRINELAKSSYSAVFDLAEVPDSLITAGLASTSFGAVNAPYFAASEIAGHLAQQGHTFGMSYFEVAPGEWQYSLRSRGDFDVSAVAKCFGGGGHRPSAGFTVPRPIHIPLVAEAVASQDEMAKVEA